MGFHEQGGAGGNRYSRVKIVRKAGSKGLLALNADGFHSSDVGVGPSLVDSEISFTGDDFLNIHNRMLVICGSPRADQLAIVDVAPLGDLKAGETVSFWRLQPNCKGGCPRMNARLGAGAVKSARAATDPELKAACAAAYAGMQAPPHNASLVIKRLPSAATLVTFEAAVPPAVTASGYNLAQRDGRSGAGARIFNNHFHDGFSRMGLLKAMNISYTGNTVERAGGLHVYSEQEWLEGDLGIRNVLVTNNTIADPTSCGMQNLSAAACLNASGHFLQGQGGLLNVSCGDNTFVAGGAEASSGAAGLAWCHPLKADDDDLWSSGA